MKKITPNEEENLEEICVCFGGNSTEKTRGHEIKNTLIVSFSFFFVFTAYFSIQNLQSSLNQEAGLGVTSLSFLYGSIILSSVLGPTIIKIIGGKLALVVPWILHIVYTLTNFYPSFYTLIPSSILLGLMSGNLWISQCVYITRNAYSLADSKGLDHHATLSRLNGMFFTVYEMTNIFGNIISSSLFYSDSDASNSTTSAYCGVDDCPELIGNGTALLKQPSKNLVYTLFGIFVVFDVIGLMLTATFLPPLPKSLWSETATIRQSVVSCFATLTTDYKMFLLVPFISMMAFEQAVLWTDFTKSYISCPVGIKMVGFIMAAYGGTTTVSALLTSNLAKYSGRHFLFAIAIIIQMAVFVAIFVYKPTGEKDIPYLFGIAIVWGLVEGIWQTQSNALVGYLFPDNPEPAFANYHSTKAASFTTYFAISTVLCVRTKLILVISLLSVATVLYVILEVKVHLERRGSADVTKSNAKKF